MWLAWRAGIEDWALRQEWSLQHLGRPVHHVAAWDILMKDCQEMTALGKEKPYCLGVFSNLRQMIASTGQQEYCLEGCCDENRKRLNVSRFDFLCCSLGSSSTEPGHMCGLGYRKCLANEDLLNNLPIRSIIASFHSLASLDS